MLLWEHLTRAWVAGIATQLMFSKTRKGVLLDPTYSSGPWHRFSKHIHLAIYTSHFKVGSLPWEFCIMIICIVLHPKILCSLSHTKKILFVYLFRLRWGMLAVGISPGCRTLWLLLPIWRSWFSNSDMMPNMTQQCIRFKCTYLLNAWKHHNSAQRCQCS